MDRPTTCHLPWRLLSVGTLLVAGCGRPGSPSADCPAGCEPRRLELPAAVQPLRSLPTERVTPAGYPAPRGPLPFPTTAEATTAEPAPTINSGSPLKTQQSAEEDEQRVANERASEPHGVQENQPALPGMALAAPDAEALTTEPLPSIEPPPTGPWPSASEPLPAVTYLPPAPVGPRMHEPPSPAASSAAATATPPAAARGVPSGPMAAVNRRADQLVGEGVALAERGALYSARAQFIQALRLLAEAHDAQAGSDVRSHALRLGLTALRESRDFRPQHVSAEIGVEVKFVAATHRTPILKGENEVSPLVATQRYLNYARAQLEIAAGNEPAASFALYGLGRIAGLATARDGSPTLGDAGQAMVYYRAALTADARNFRAANELGVLLGDNGRWDLARDMFLHGLKVTQEPAMWRNLAVAYERSGQPALAAQARSRIPQGQSGNPEMRCQWLDPATFARTPSATDASTMPPQGVPNGPAAGGNMGTAAQPVWGRTQRR